VKKILIIQTAFMGDTVLATALAVKLNKYFPEAKIDFLLRKGNEGLLKHHPMISRVLIWNKKSNKYGNLIGLWKQVRAERYDLLINLQRYWATGFLTAFSGARETRGFSSNPMSFLFTKSYSHDFDPSTARHEIYRNQNLIADITDELPSMPMLPVDAESEQTISCYCKKPYITITAGSVWFTKRLPIEKWIDFINKVPTHYNIYLLGGKDEQVLNEQILKQCSRPEVHNLAGKQSFGESFALMRTAEMNYVNDSAPLHFCSALNAPVTSVFCSTSPDFGFGPLSKRSFVVETREKLSCRPCGVHGRKSCPRKHFSCAYGIDTNQLLETLKHDAI
jgi:heptosyltransferase-2